MFGFGNKKKEEEEKAEKAQAEKTAQAMRSMSDQLAQKGKEIGDLEDKLDAAKKDVAAGDHAEKALADARAELAKLKIEAAKAKAEAARVATAAAAAAHASTSTAIPGAGKLGSATPAAPAGTVLGSAPEAPAAGGLAAGVTAYVQKAGGKNLRLRDKPGLDSNAFAGLAPGTSMTLLDGPVQDDGYPWWHIRTSDGREGWVAGTELVTTPQ